MIPYFIKFNTKDFAGAGFSYGSVWYADPRNKTMQWVNAGAEGMLKEIFRLKYGAEIGYIEAKDKYPIHVRCMELDELTVVKKQLKW